MKKLIFLEWGRGIAALLVVLHHGTLDAPFFYNYKPFENIFYFGMAGVDFFFILSGFIIYYIHSNDTGTVYNIKKYLIKRLIRIYPIFLIISSILLVAYLFLPQLSNRLNLLDVPLLITSFLLLPSSIPPILTVSWTLVHEMFFYLLFIIVILNKKLGLSILLLWGGLIVFLNISNQELTFPNSFYFNFHNLEFVFGVFVAFSIKKNYIFIKNQYLIYFLFLGLLIFIINGMNQNYKLLEISHLITTFIYGLSSTIIVYSLVQLPQNYNKNYITKKLVLLGAASYSIYLIHLPILSVLHRIVSKFQLQIYIHPNIIFLILVIMAVLSGIVTHLLIEKPIIRWLKNIFFTNGEK